MMGTSRHDPHLLVFILRGQGDRYHGSWRTQVAPHDTMLRS